MKPHKSEDPLRDLLYQVYSEEISRVKTPAFPGMPEPMAEVQGERVSLKPHMWVRMAKAACVLVLLGLMGLTFLNHQPSALARQSAIFMEHHQVMEKIPEGVKFLQDLFQAGQSGSVPPEKKPFSQVESRLCLEQNLQGFQKIDLRSTAKSL